MGLDAGVGSPDPGNGVLLRGAWSLRAGRWQVEWGHGREDSVHRLPVCFSPFPFLSLAGLCLPGMHCMSPWALGGGTRTQWTGMGGFAP